MSIDFPKFQQFLNIFEPDLKKQFLSYGKLKNISGGKIVLDIREPIEFIPVIVNGLARVTRRDGRGNSILLHYLTDNETCTLSFFNASQNKPNNIRITSKTNLIYVQIPIAMAKTWFFKYEVWHRYITKLAQEQNESLIRLINEVTFEKLEVVLKNHLFYLQSKFKSNTIITNHQDIARNLYVSRESVSRTLKKMESRGLIKLGRNKIVIN